MLEISDEKDAIHAELLQATCVPTKGAVEFIQTVAQRNIPQAVASGAALQEIKVFLEMNKLSEHFEDHRLFGRGMYEAFKPHPASFDAGFFVAWLRRY